LGSQLDEMNRQHQSDLEKIQTKQKAAKEKLAQDHAKELAEHSEKQKQAIEASKLCGLPVLDLSKSSFKFDSVRKRKSTNL